MDWLTPGIHRILKLNPIYYITSGYRDAFLDKVWFWEKGRVDLIFLGGDTAYWHGRDTGFKKLEKHFADVL